MIIIMIIYFIIVRSNVDRHVRTDTVHFVIEKCIMFAFSKFYIVQNLPQREDDMY